MANPTRLVPLKAASLSLIGLQTSLAAWAVAPPITFGNYALTILLATPLQKRNSLTICGAINRTLISTSCLLHPAPP